MCTFTPLKSCSDSKTRNSLQAKESLSLFDLRDKVENILSAYQEYAGLLSTGDKTITTGMIGLFLNEASEKLLLLMNNE